MLALVGVPVNCGTPAPRKQSATEQQADTGALVTQTSMRTRQTLKARPLGDKIVAYPVGGAVRDLLLGQTPSDVDWVVVGATPEYMTASGFVPVGKDFPVFLHPETKEEYALARTEKKQAPGYHGFVCYSSPDVSLQDDLARRDLTINAMALGLEGELIDPFGGQVDLQHKCLRHVTPAFEEDPVRILRVARFSARLAPLGFEVHPSTMELMKTMVKKGEVDALVPERVWKETEKALSESAPQAYFSVLRACDALATVFPEIDCLFGIPNPKKWHPEIDTGVHTLMVLEQAAHLSADPMTRFAALCHDLGKGLTPSSEWPSHKGHEKKGIQVIRDLCERLRTPKTWRELAEIASEFHLHAHRIFDMTASTIVTTLERLDAFRRPARFGQFLVVCEADFRGRTGYEHKPYPNAAYFQGCFDAAAQASVETILQQGHTGKSIAQHLHRLRVEKVREYQQHHQGRTD